MTTTTTKLRSQRGWRALRTFKSRSNPRIRHQVRLAADRETIYCTCRGFTYHGKCWHHDRVINNIACGMVPDNWHAMVNDV